MKIYRNIIKVKFDNLNLFQDVIFGLILIIQSSVFNSLKDTVIEIA